MAASTSAASSAPSAAMTSPRLRSVSAGSNPRLRTASSYAVSCLSLFLANHPVCSASAARSSASASPSTRDPYPSRILPPPFPSTYVANRSAPLVRRRVASRRSSARAVARSTHDRTASSCAPKSASMAATYASMASSTPTAAATSADAAARSAARISSAASKRRVPTWSGVPSLRRMPSPPRDPPPRDPPPPRKLRTYSSSSSKPEPSRDRPSCLRLSASLAETGMTAGSVTPNRRSALSATNARTSFTSSTPSRRSHLLTTKSTFLPHLRMYLRNLTSDSVIGRSAESTNSTRSARGTNSSVRRCCRSRITFVPGVSTMFTSRRRSAGMYCV